ncbi:hypothetical protein [Mammaliicoccus phage vB_MscM-PMS3]|nr:hypothetical protein [Mammaliicoccus phage vB_MscM-PMS3]
MDKVKITEFFTNLKGIAEEKGATNLLVGSPPRIDNTDEICDYIVQLEFWYNDKFHITSTNGYSEEDDQFELLFLDREDEPWLYPVGKFRTEEEFLQLL